VVEVETSKEGKQTLSVPPPSDGGVVPVMEW
jgi:hypothetical protein